MLLDQARVLGVTGATRTAEFAGTALAALADAMSEFQAKCCLRELNQFSFYLIIGVDKSKRLFLILYLTNILYLVIAG